jgi:hypothetical protein
MIRDFRGALIGRADKGVLLTTGSFTMDAKREAIQDGANPIELSESEYDDQECTFGNHPLVSWLPHP